MKKILLFSICSLVYSLNFAQRTPAANAAVATPTLTFSVGITNASSVVYNPNFDLYYIIRSGNAGFPLETLTSDGTPVYQTNAGIDSRGIWWNPNTNQVERNCYAGIGWTTVDVDASGNALNTYSTIFTGQLQPDIQSVGAYDYLNDEVLFYNGGNSIYPYDRQTGAALASLTLTGITLTNTCYNTVIYTGETGYEIGVLDYLSKIVYLFNRSTGALSGQSELPDDAVTNNVFRFSYANFRVWLNDVNTATWHSYNIWNELLPVTLTSFTAHKQDENILLQWKTSSEINNSHYEIERSPNIKTFTQIASVKGSNAVNGSSYSYADTKPVNGMNYYRLKQVDKDGKYMYSNIVSVNFAHAEYNVSVYPNPASKGITITLPKSNTVSSIHIFDMNGKKVANTNVDANVTYKQLDISSLAPGIYNLVLYQGTKKLTVKLIKK